jgi:hypothetical protein
MKEHMVVFQKILGKDHKARQRLITILLLLSLFVVVAYIIADHLGDLDEIM